MAPPIDTKKGGFYETQQPKKGGIITINKAPSQGFPNSLHAKTSVFFSPSTPSKMKKKVSSTTTALTAHVKQEVVTADSKIQMLARCKTNLFSAESSLICKFNLEWS